MGCQGETSRWSKDTHIKPSVVVNHKVSRISLLRADIIRTHKGVTNKEYGEVEPDNVIVPFLGVELCSESSGVPRRVRKLSLGAINFEMMFIHDELTHSVSYSRETRVTGRLNAWLKQACFGEVRYCKE